MLVLFRLLTGQVEFFYSVSFNQLHLTVYRRTLISFSERPISHCALNTLPLGYKTSKLIKYGEIFPFILGYINAHKCTL